MLNIDITKTRQLRIICQIQIPRLTTNNCIMQDASTNYHNLGEMYRKDDIDVSISNQEHTAPVYFQSLSLD